MRNQDIREFLGIIIKEGKKKKYIRNKDEGELTRIVIKEKKNDKLNYSKKLVADDIVIQGEAVSIDNV